MILDFNCKFQRTLAIAGAGVGIASAGYGIYKGAKADSDKKKDIREKESLQRPAEKVQDEYFQNQNIAKQIASGGLTDASKNLFETENNRGITAGVNALTSGGGDLNMISKLFDNYANKTVGLASEDAQQHLRNIEYYTGVNKDIAGQKTIQYGVNELQPYENKLKELSGRIVADKQNADNGYQQAIGSLANTNFGRAKNPAGESDPYVRPSSIVEPLSSTGMSADTSQALAKYLTRTSGSANFGRSASEQDLFEGN